MGERLAADLEALIRTNALLGAGVDGVAKPGYGNLQWDSYRHPDFKPACDKARIAPRSHFYDVARLKACYGR